MIYRLIRAIFKKLIRSRRVLLISFFILIIAGSLYLASREKSPRALIGPVENPSGQLVAASPTLSVAQALEIAKNSDCVSLGPILQEQPLYNPNSKSWWFPIKADKPGCNPACVILEETKTAEVNWRCTGLAVKPIDQVEESIRQLFADKYKKSKDSIEIFIDRQDASHVRGNVQFSSASEAGEGGTFLAAKIDNKWQLFFDGNGSIPCSLAGAGFPDEMLSDCVRQ